MPMYRQVVLLCAVVYLFTAKGYLEISDTVASYQTADALVTRGGLDIPPADTVTLNGPDGRSYSKYGVGLPLYYAPWVAAGRLLARATGAPALEVTWFLLSFANVPLTLLTLRSFARCLRLFGTAGRSGTLLVAGLGLGTLCWRYACCDFSEALQACLLLVAFETAVRGGTRPAAAGGAAFAALVLVKLVHAALLPALLVYLLTTPGEPLRRRVGRAALFTAPVVLALGLVAVLNAVRFGSPLESGYGGEAARFFPSQVWWTVPRLLGSLDKGLFVFCPVLVLGLLGWPAFARRRPRECALCATLIAGNLLLAAAWHSWEGGWCWGPRLLVPAVPLWLLPAVFWVADAKPRRLAFAAALVLVSTVAQVAGVLVKDQQIHHIKLNVLTPEERPLADPDSAVAWSLLRHKLTAPGDREVYRVSEVGVPGDREFDAGQFRTFRGVNVWTEHAARQFGRPAIRWLPAVGLVAAGCLAALVTAGLILSRPATASGAEDHPGGGRP